MCISYPRNVRQSLVEQIRLELQPQDMLNTRMRNIDSFSKLV